MIRTNKLKGKQLVERLKKLAQPIQEMFPIVSPQPLHLRTNKMKPITKNIMDLDDEDEIDLQKLIDEFESEEEVDIGDTDEQELREYIHQCIKEEWLEKLKKLK